MFGIGVPEFAILAVLAAVLIGPDRLPDFARQAGHLTRKARTMLRSARDELRSELGPEFADMELRDLDPRVVVSHHLAEALAEDDNIDDPGNPSVNGDVFKTSPEGGAQGDG